MRTAIFTIDTESYEAKKKSAAGEALKRMLEQNRLEVKAAKVLPRDKEVVATVFLPAGRLGLCRTDHNDRGDGIFRAGLCSEGGRRSRRAAYSGNPGSA